MISELSRTCSLQSVNGILLVSLINGLDEMGLQESLSLISKQLQKKSYRAVFIDVSSLSIIGPQGLVIIENMGKLVNVMGTRVVFVGFQAGVAAAVMDLNLDFSNMNTALTVDDAFILLDGLQESTHF